jgi:PHD/YefM family antitoxin component YafN of YafNO toxin-antitoxin module
MGKTKRLGRKGEMNSVQEHYVIDTKGRKMGVILSLKRYQRLIEDLHDLAVVAERREEKPMSLEEMKRRLKKDALL